MRSRKNASNTVRIQIISWRNGSLRVSPLFVRPSLQHQCIFLPAFLSSKVCKCHYHLHFIGKLILLPVSLCQASFTRSVTRKGKKKAISSDDLHIIKFIECSLSGLIIPEQETTYVGRPSWLWGSFVISRCNRVDPLTASRAVLW